MFTVAMEHLDTVPWMQLGIWSSLSWIISTVTTFFSGLFWPLLARSPLKQQNIRTCTIKPGSTYLNDKGSITTTTKADWAFIRIGFPFLHHNNNNN